MFSAEEILEEFVGQIRFVKRNNVWKQWFHPGYDWLLIRRREIDRKSFFKRYHSMTAAQRLAKREKNRLDQLRWYKNPANKAKKRVAMKAYMKEYNSRPEVKELRKGYNKAYRERRKNAKQS